ncbi:hypothetical protein M2139_001751 [Enterococcus sp. PF1-24]|uniref:hypothetical protein n=1 Tax=unclassified Enterococcus TaxID=2608891 RepID=UPI002473DF9F|nr:MULTISPECIES: hypothetical protein [unclassified Enterococcus]MDH6364804.1 hypothetical protein [Enterococcus sp. PFB1-1]MDH6401851.1 hypothetical protein [Enterococcus sp. PF1-24]
MLDILIPCIAGLIGVIIGGIIVVVAFNLKTKYEEKKQLRNQELMFTVKEIETLNLLNAKINDILQKGLLLKPEYVSFDAFDDCYVPIDDFVYLKSFASQNNFYLPTYLIEEFFKNISHRRVILSPDETVRLGGYTYTGGRIILETFSDELVSIMEEKKRHMKALTNQPLSYFLKD